MRQMIVFMVQVGGKMVKAVTITSQTAGTSAAGGSSRVDQMTFIPRSFCSSVTSDVGSANTLHSEPQTEADVEKVIFTPHCSMCGGFYAN